MCERYESISPAMIKTNIGNYIKLQGKGILDGLTQPTCKNFLFKIVGLCLDLDAAVEMAKLVQTQCAVDLNDEKLFEKVELRQYRKRYARFLPKCHWDQACEIYTPKEFKDSPIY